MMGDKQVLLFCPHDVEMLKSELEVDFRVVCETQASKLASEVGKGYDAIIILGMVTEAWQGQLGAEAERQIGEYLHQGGTAILVHEAIYGGANPVLVKDVLGLKDINAFPAEELDTIAIYPEEEGDYSFVAGFFEKFDVKPQELFDYREQVPKRSLVLSGVTHHSHREIRLPIAWVQKTGKGRALCCVLSHYSAGLRQHMRNVVLQGVWGLTCGERPRDLVFLTGAGASKPFGQNSRRSDDQETEGFPLMGDFMLEIDHRLRRSTEVSEQAKAMWQRLFKHCEGEGPLDLERGLEVLNLLDSARFYDGLAVWSDAPGDQAEDDGMDKQEGPGRAAQTCGPAIETACPRAGYGEEDAEQTRESAGELLQKIRWFIRDRLSRISAVHDPGEHWRLLCGPDLPARLLLFATTNYDRIHERVLRNMQLEYVDGFRGTRWEPGVLLEHSSAVRLLKLHGSIDWFQASQSGTIIRSELIAETATHPDTGELMSEVIIYPTQAKTLAGEPFAEIFCRFREMMLGFDGILIIVGHSLRDDEIVGVIDEALRRDRRMRIVLVDPNAESLVKERFGHSRGGNVIPLRASFGSPQAILDLRRTLQELDLDTVSRRSPTVIKFDKPGDATNLGWEFGEGSGEAKIEQMGSHGPFLLSVSGEKQKWALDYTFPYALAADALTVELMSDGIFSFYLRIRLSDHSCRWLNYTSDKPEGWNKRATAGEWRVGLGTAACTGSLEKISRDIFADVAATYGENGRFLDRVLAFRMRGDWHLHSVSLAWRVDR